MTTETLTRETLKTTIYRACPRCRGDLVLDREDGYVAPAAIGYVCLQRGHQVALHALAIRPVKNAAQVV